MVSKLASSAVGCGFKPRLCQTKDYKIGTCTFVFVASPLSIHAALRRRTKTGWLGICLMCPSGAPCLSANCCFNKLAL